MDIRRIVNRRAGGGSPHNFPFFPYTPALGVSDTQRLNCTESFHTVLKMHNTRNLSGLISRLIASRGTGCSLGVRLARGD